MNKILDNLGLVPVVFFGSIFTLMPILPEPHLWQKFMMIKNNLYMAPIDWFDICMHGSAALLVIAKVVRHRQVSGKGGPNNGPSNTEE